jgi:hypothetical protein
MTFSIDSGNGVHDGRARNLASAQKDGVHCDGFAVIFKRAERIGAIFFEKVS